MFKDHIKTGCDNMGCNVFDNLSFSVLVIDKDYNVLSMNKKASEFLDSSKEERTKCYNLTHNREKRCWEYGEMCPLRECMETKSFARAVHKHIYNGKEIFEEISATPVFDDKGELIYIIEELRDISKLLKLETVINSLRNEVKTLQGLLPICASCKKIRDDEGYWSEVDKYISDRSEIKFSHSICPDCMKDLYPEVAERLKNKKNTK
ncbi:MAG TPA: PAS domain-containing protein [Clostridiales bacterium]|nr:PAS domain-containing protein [Clostridiales bacterium]